MKYFHIYVNCVNLLYQVQQTKGTRKHSNIYTLYVLNKLTMLLRATGYGDFLEYLLQIRGAIKKLQDFFSERMQCCSLLSWQR